MVHLDPEFAPDHQFASVSEFLAAPSAPVGCVRVMLDRAPLDFRYLDKGADRLGVFFTAAVPKDSLAPRFTGFGVSREISMNTLHFADPAVVLTSELFLAWYTGWQGVPLQRLMQSIVQRYRDWLGPGTPTVLYGGSAGGFASLVCGFGLSGVTSIAANPQTDLRFYNRALVKRWRQACWPEGPQELDDALPEIPAVTDAVTLYGDQAGKGIRNNVVILQNTGDVDHFDAHFLPLRSALEGTGTMRYLLGDWGHGHKAPPTDVIKDVLRAAVENDWQSASWSRIGARLA